MNLLFCLHVSVEMSAEARKRIDAKKKKVQVDTNATYAAVVKKYKSFLDFLRENVKIDEMNKSFHDSFTPEPGVVLYSKYDPSKIICTKRTNKTATGKGGEEINYSVIPERINDSTGSSRPLKIQGPIMLIDLGVGQFGPTAKLRFRRGNEYDMEFLRLWNNHYEHECTMIVEQGLVNSSISEGLRATVAMGMLKNPVYTPVDEYGKVIEGVDKTMFLKILDYSGNTTNIMFPNGYRVSHKEFYGVTLVALPIILVQQIHVGSKPSSQRFLASAIVYDIIETPSMMERMKSQVDATLAVLPSLKTMDGFVPDSSVEIPTPSVIAEIGSSEDSMFIPTSDVSTGEPSNKPKNTASNIYEFFNKP